jgi:hypothetical protein
LAELASRFFATRGPATLDDFAWWSGLTKGDAKRGVESAGPALKHSLIEARGHWFPAPARSGGRKSTDVRLLPMYDEYFIGLKDRGAMLARLRLSGVEAKLDLFSNSLMIDGQIVGGWKRILRGKSMVVEAKSVTALDAAENRAIARQVRRFAEFLELPVQLELTEGRS